MNVTTIAREETGFFEIFIKTDSNGDYVTPDALPVFKIFSPDDTELFTDTAYVKEKGIYVGEWTVPISAVASSSYYIKWFVTVNKIEHEIIENFTVVESKAYSGSINVRSDIIISEKHLKEIKASIGYPLQTNIILDDNQIKDLAVAKALRRYFTKFPLSELYETITGGSSLTVPFPDDNTFGVLDIRIVNKGYNADPTTEGFWSVYSFNSLYPNKRRIGKYGTKYSFSMDGFDEYENKRMMLMSEMNRSTINYKVDITNRQVIVFSEVTGTLQIQWAKESNNFNHVKFEELENVIRLSQAYLMRHLADTGQLTENPDEEQLNSDALNDKADKIFEEVKEYWDSIPDVIVIT